MWIVVDNAENTQSFYRSTGTDDGTLIGISPYTYTFRTSTTDSIETLQLLAHHGNPILLDDFYISSGVNTTFIPEPSVGILLLLAAAGLGTRRPRRHAPAARRR